MNCSQHELQQALERHATLVQTLRQQVRAGELQATQPGGMPPPEAANTIAALLARIQYHEAEIARLQTLAAEATFSLAEATYRILLAETWGTPSGRPTVAGEMRLEWERLRLGIGPERAAELAQAVRVALAQETFYGIERGLFAYQLALMSKRDETVKQQVFQVLNVRLPYLHAEHYDQIVQEEVLGIVANQEGLHLLGRAIRLDCATALHLFLMNLPDEPPRIVYKPIIPLDAALVAELPPHLRPGTMRPYIDLAVFKAHLFKANNVWPGQDDSVLFAQFMMELAAGLEQKL